MNLQTLDETFKNYTLSYGNLNEPALLEVYHKFLMAHYPRYNHTNTFFEANFYLAYFKVCEESPELVLAQLTEIGHTNLACLVNETLPDMLQEIAPPETYFGSHPGCGSDLGFWTNEEEDSTIL